MVRLLPVLLLALATSALAATAGFTPAEKATVQKLGDKLKADCAQQIAQMQASSKMADLQASPMGKLFSLDQWTDYCPCVAAEFQHRVTPAQLRHGSQQDGAALVRTSATACAVRHLKASFPSTCGAMGDMLAASAAASAPAPAAMDQFCRCTQVDIDKLDETNFDGFTKQTLADYATYHRSGEVPDSPGPSLLGSMQRCGLQKLRGGQPQ